MANPTLNTVIAQARAILQDEVADEYRYTTARLERYVNDYIQEMRRDFPGTHSRHSSRAGLRESKMNRPPGSRWAAIVSQSAR